MSRTITLTKRTIAILLVVTAVTSIAAASILANYVVPINTVRVTSSPGLTAYEADGVTAIQSIDWGDVQQSTTQTHQVILKNTGGSQVLYILENPRDQNLGVVTTISSLSAQSLPTGLTLSWNMHDLSNAFCVVSGVTYQGCFALGQGSGTSAITMSLSASSTAPPTANAVNFQITFNGYSSVSG